MCSGQENTEMLSSKAAAFSIANLLNDDIKRTASRASNSELSTSRNPAFPAHAEPLRQNPRISASHQHRSSLTENQPTSNVALEERRIKREGYTIRNILENATVKGTGQEDLMSTRCQDSSRVHERTNPLRQHAEYDLVRNIDFMRTSLFFKDVPRMPHTLREIQVALQQSDLWWKFYSCGTEMVITRTGRRMFPTLSLSFFGMDPKKYYALHVDLVPVDRYNYTFVNNTWQVNAIASEMHPTTYIQSYQADEVVHTGLYWMKNGVDFKKLRLTNRRTGVFKEGELQLSPNRKYQPRIHVIEETEDGAKISCSTYVFPETSFIAVTTYQNEELIQMKIDHNPFAKGFRDKGARRRFVPYDQRPICG